MEAFYPIDLSQGCPFRIRVDLVNLWLKKAHSQ